MPRQFSLREISKMLEGGVLRQEDADRLAEERLDQEFSAYNTLREKESTAKDEGEVERFQGDWVRMPDGTLRFIKDKTWREPYGKQK